MLNKKILDVVKVGFNGNTGDNRSPESFAFPACMTSLMEYLGEDYPRLNIEENNYNYTVRTGNVSFLAASGMAFGLLWHKEYCLGSMDLTQVNEHDLTIQYAFDWAGYDFEIINANNNYHTIKEKIVKAINEGIPVLAFGIIGPPECSIITGYDEFGDVLIGWSHFQEWEACEKENNGMFRKRNWFDNLWKIVITGEKVSKKRNIEDIIKRGLNIMEKSTCDGYTAGLKAYEEWINFLLDKELSNINDEDLKIRFRYHHLLVGNLAEARYYLGDFFNYYNEELKNEKFKLIANCFKTIHKLCWQVWGVLGSLNDKELWKNFKDFENRKKIAGIISEIKALDEKAMNYMRGS